MIARTNHLILATGFSSLMFSPLKNHIARNARSNESESIRLAAQNTMTEIARINRSFMRISKCVNIIYNFGE